MKNFLASLLGTLAGLFVFSIVGVLLAAGMLGAVIALGGKQAAEVERGAYLVFDLTAVISDAPPHASGAALLAALGGAEDGPHAYQLREVTTALRKAAKDEKISGVLLLGRVPAGSGYSNGYAALKEVRQALLEVRSAGKPVVAYLEEVGTKDLFVASVANEVVMDPYGTVMMAGLAAEPLFMAGAFEKFGIGVQVTRVGKYKSAVEPFTRKDMSPENREQMQKLLDDLWSDLISDIAQARGTSKELVQAAVDREGIFRAETALEAKLVTRIGYRDEVFSSIKEKTGVDSTGKTFKQISLGDYIGNLRDGAGKHGEGGQIAVVYADGVIVDGDGETGEVGGVAFAREMRRLRQDKDVKAIVLRVNSPGGSASASERIQREIRLARDAKPVVVSMGSYAASGGYWISTYGDRIFAEPTTITGSIGVFGMMMNIEKLANDLGLTFDRVKTGKFADALSSSRPKTPEEMALMQRLVDWIYGEFVNKVVESRKLPAERVREIAQGRVWSGIEAQKLGLVDEIGGLDAAVSYAAEKAGLGQKYHITEFPAPKSLSEILGDLLGGLSPANTRAGAITRMIESVRAEIEMLEQFNDSRGIYARVPFEIRIR